MTFRWRATLGRRANIISTVLFVSVLLSLAAVSFWHGSAYVALVFLLLAALNLAIGIVR